MKVLLHDGKYYVPSGEVNTITLPQVKAFLKKRSKISWTHFDVLVSDESKMWFIEPNPVNWKLGTCSCPYLKNYICKHVIAVSVTLRLDGCIIPLTSKHLGQKRKRGAPKKAAQALIRQ